MIFMTKAPDFIVETYVNTINTPIVSPGEFISYVQQETFIFAEFVQESSEVITEGFISSAIEKIKELIKKFIDFLKSLKDKIKSFFTKQSNYVKDSSNKVEDSIKKAEEKAKGDKTETNDNKDKDVEEFTFKYFKYLDRILEFNFQTLDFNSAYVLFEKTSQNYGTFMEYIDRIKSVGSYPTKDDANELRGILKEALEDSQKLILDDIKKCCPKQLGNVESLGDANKEISDFLDADNIDSEELHFKSYRDAVKYMKDNHIASLNKDISIKLNKWGEETSRNIDKFVAGLNDDLREIDKIRYKINEFANTLNQNAPDVVTAFENVFQYLMTQMGSVINMSNQLIYFKNNTANKINVLLTKSTNQLTEFNMAYQKYFKSI